jgi:hypothetical protein
MDIELIEVTDDRIDWSNFGTMKYMTCRNHTGARYLTKNPWQRSLHFITPDPSQTWECPCPFSDLVVIAEDGKVDN